MQSFRLPFFVTLLNVALFAAAPAAPERELDRSISRAAKTFAQSHSSVRSFRIQVEGVSGNYARVRAWPTRGTIADPAWIFLKNDRGTWRGIVLGTSFTARDYRELGIPRELRLP
jgi:hypothetical protein